MPRWIFCIIGTFFVVGIVRGETGPSQLDIGSKQSQAVSLIAAGKSAQADSAVAEIMEMPASREKGQSLQQIAGAYQRAKEYDKAIRICDYVLENWPKEDFAVWAGMSKALSQMDKGDKTAVEETIERITNDCTDDANLPWALSIIADGYAANGMDSQAAKVREVVMDKSPESIWGAQAQILSFINQKGYKVALNRLNSLVKDFNGNPNLSEIVFRLGQEFCWKRRYAEGNDVFARLDADKARLWRQCAITCNLVRQGEDDQAAKALKKMNADFLNNPGLAEAIYRVGQELEWCKGEQAAGPREYVASLEAYKRVMRQFGSTSYGKQADWDKKRLECRIVILNAIENDYEAEIVPSVSRLITELEGRPELYKELSWLEAWAREHNKTSAADRIKEQHSAYRKLKGLNDEK